MKPSLFGACVLSLLAGAGASSPAASVPEPPRPHRPPAYLGAVVTPPLPKPRFTLTDTAGAPFDFWANTRGYVTLLFFGYTRCPDACPMHMVNVATGLKKLPAPSRDRIRLVFVTTDPMHDDPRALRSWLDHFDSRFIGLTGSDAAVEAAQRAAGLPPAQKAVRAGNDYAVSHANVVLAYTRDNLAHLMYPGGVTGQDWAHDLAQLVNETW